MKVRGGIPGTAATASAIPLFHYLYDFSIILLDSLFITLNVNNCISSFDLLDTDHSLKSIQFYLDFKFILMTSFRRTQGSQIRISRMLVMTSQTCWSLGVYGRLTRITF